MVGPLFRGCLSALAVTALASCAQQGTEIVESSPAVTPPAGATLVEIARSSRQWTGVTVSRDGRRFVNFPRWSSDVPVSVAELIDGQPVPYPDTARNSWSASGDAAEQFVCVQSVVADRAGSLWVLDPANPRFSGVRAEGVKLMRFDLATGGLVRAYRYQEPVVHPTSYLNDVRLDLEAGVAYITDSGAGALITTDLETGESRRLLDAHPSTQAEDVVLVIEGKEWRRPGGEQPQVHADGIALTPDGRFLYYQALTGRTLYRVATSALRDRSLSPEALAAQVESMGRTGAADGLIFGPDGRLYITAIEDNAIKSFDPETRRLEVVVQDPLIRWPDSFALDPRGRILFTTSQIHLGPDVTQPYRIFAVEGASAPPS